MVPHNLSPQQNCPLTSRASLTDSSALSRAIWLVILAVCASLPGCRDGRPHRVVVSGRVLIDGQPVEHGNVRFHPADHRPASGKLGPGGRFELSTYERADGCVLGVHPVTVNALEVLGASSQRWHAPKKYRDPSTSGLVAEITEPTDAVEIELTWDGGKPFVERTSDWATGD